jgi:hypothetical protein
MRRGEIGLELAVRRCKVTAYQMEVPSRNSQSDRSEQSSTVGGEDRTVYRTQLIQTVVQFNG